MRKIEKSIAECISRVDFVALAPERPVAEAMAGMREKGTHCALVVDGDALIGIFTERDFLQRVAAARRNPAEVLLREVMTPDPDTLHPHDCVSYAINRMAVAHYRNVPIVDSRGRPTSVLDVRMVMMHLLKVFAELERDGGAGEADSEWIDIGGG